MSFFNALVREFFSQDPFNSVPVAMPGPMPATHQRVAPVVRMTKMTQMVEGLMLNGGPDTNPSVTMHRTS